MVDETQSGNLPATDGIPDPAEEHQAEEHQALRDAGEETLADLPLSDELPTVTDETGGDEAATMLRPHAPPIPDMPVNHDIPGYELLGELGRGGMGVVYKARETKLKRTVAIKMILNGEYSSQDEMQRFQLEAEAVAQLQHPHFVQIYNVGEYEGRKFISLEFVDGGSLDKTINGVPQNAKQSARLVELLARAMEVAHQQGIVHRDLKPANIMLTSDGEPKVTDFGLAKIMNENRGTTRSGAILGTPSYMAPEQAASKGGSIGPAADIYALGAILYHMLTGRPPFRAETELDTLIQVIEDQPVSPRRLNSSVPVDLEKIILKCLEKEVHHRYAAAEDLANDLRRFLDGTPISIRSVNLVDKLTRSLQRSKHDLDLSSWGHMLYWIGAIVFLAEVGIYFNSREGPPYELKWAVLIRIIQFASLGYVLWRYREHWSISIGSVERQMLSMWIAFFFGCWWCLAVEYLMSTPQQPLNQITLYPYFAILSGVIYFVMGSNYWGQCYLFGILFFLLALTMPLDLYLAPLEFGGLWGLCLALIGRRLKLLNAAEHSTS